MICADANGKLSFDLPEDVNLEIHKYRCPHPEENGTCDGVIQFVSCTVETVGRQLGIGPDEKVFVYHTRCYLCKGAGSVARPIVFTDSDDDRDKRPATHKFMSSVAQDI